MPPEAAPPQRIGRYVVLGELGRGAMGIVYRVRDPRIDRPVALKTLSPLLGAYHLEYVLGQSVTLPASYVAIVVPLIQNTKRESWPEMNHYLHEPVRQLEVYCEGEVLEQRAATIKRFRAADLRQKVLHFSAHGLFPEPDSAGYRRRGRGEMRSGSSGRSRRRARPACSRAIGTSTPK